MASVLDKILAHKRSELEALRPGLAEVKARAADTPRPRDMLAALRAREVAIISEVKRKSPSRGEIRPGADPAEIARSYEANGAAAISVLTDGYFFGGSLEDLARVRGSVALPVLRKDFIIDPVQLYEARVFGADAALLMASALEDGPLRDLYGLAGELGLAALVEVHDEEECARAARLKPALVGINNRNLKTLAVDLETCIRLRPRFGEEALVIAESGIKTAAEVRRLQGSGLGGFLVGSSLMSAPDPGLALAALLEAA